MGNEKGLPGDRNLRMGLAIIFMLLIAMPVMALIAYQGSDHDDGDGENPTGSSSVVGDMSMDTTSREEWERFLGSAREIDLSTGSMLDEATSENAEILEDAPLMNDTDVDFKEEDDRSGEDGQYGEGTNSADDGLSEPAADRESEDGDGSDREVEESDIVKVIGSRMYVLNHYRGLMVINLDDTEDPYLEGSVRLPGNPVSMYVVDFLGFVIVSNAPSPGSEKGYSGMMYIVDLTDNSDPRVVKAVELDGYPVDSRRVGEVIYVVSNEQNIYRGPMPMGAMVEDEIAIAVQENEPPYRKETPSTFVTSVGFYDPHEMGERDRAEVEGNAGMIHASSFAIYVPQPNNDHTDPETRFVYVDISDPEGDIEVKDSIDVPGLLIDRYQMDHYEGMFRVVTQKWPSGDVWGELPMSTLYVIDANDPDDLEIISSLLIDDSGNLMATRFAGERAYTIHLPRTIDPLDVIDLSDPSDPRLTDILELPGWVEHMEVIGYNIIAVGVDDSADDGWKVAVSLFDVTDASDAILEDRIIIGEGHTYSSANYDPKALTILEEKGLVLIPFNSHDWNRYEGSHSGVQLVSFDLGSGDLEKRGTIGSGDAVQRTRMVKGAVVTMSQRFVDTVDVTDPDSPTIMGSVELASDLFDALLVGDRIVSLERPLWGETGGTIRVSDGETPYSSISEHGPQGLEFTTMKREGTRVYVKGIRQFDVVPPVSELHMYDMTDPDDPVHKGPVRIPVPEIHLTPYYGKDEPSARDREEGQDSSSGVSGFGRLYYDPVPWKLLSDGSVLLHSRNGYGYYHGEEEIDVKLHVVSFTGQPSVTNYSIGVDSGFGEIEGSSDRIILIYNEWREPSTFVTSVDLDQGEAVVGSTRRLSGTFIGASSDLSMVYTRATYYEEDRVRRTISTYNIDDNGSSPVRTVDVKSPLGDVRFLGDSILIISYGWDVWWGYQYREDMEYAEDEKASAGSTDGDDPDQYRKPDYNVKVSLLELEEGRPGNISSISSDNYVSVSVINREMLVLGTGNQNSIYSLDEGIHGLMSWTGNGRVTGGDLNGNRVVLAMGMYGLEYREL